MRTTSDALASILTGSRQVSSSIGVFYDGKPVFDDIRVAGGSLTVDGSQDVTGTLELSLPRYAPDETGAVVDLMPSEDNDSPINAEGTQVALAYHVGIPGSEPETIGLGWFRIDDWGEGDDGTIDVTALSVEAPIAEARFLAPFNVASGTTFANAARQLVGSLVPLEITASASPVVPKQTFEDDRLAALRELVTAWPARMVAEDSGALVIAPPLNDETDPVVVTLTDGEGGTVVRVPRSGSRTGIYNAVKASGESTGESEPVSAVAYITTGPRRWNGPYGNVPYFYASPLLTTKAQCAAASKTILDRLQILAKPVTISAAPDPRLEVGDVIAVGYRGRVEVVRVDAITLPLLAADGTMTITGHVISGRVAP